MPRSKKRSIWPKILIFSTLILVALFLGGVYLLRQVYENNLRPISNSSQVVEVTIPLGATESDIADILKANGLIREGWVFEWFIRNEDLREYLKAGTYDLSPNMSVQEIASIITEGRVASDLVTILPGKRIDEIRDSFINQFGFEPAEVDAALNPSLYSNHPALVDKPRGASLEGYLYPESFQKTAETDPQTLIRASLDEMQKHLTPGIRAGIVRRGLTVHEGIILASIIENEVSKSGDKPKVAQVFLKRLKEGIRLESDATSAYGAVLDGAEPSIAYNSKYNTYQNAGLTPTPISNVTGSSLNAVAKPANTEFLYFVSGDDGTTHFSFTLNEHQEKTRKYCTKLCQ